MPLPKHVYEEMIERHAAAHRIGARLRFWAWFRTLLLCWFWLLLGMFLVGWSFHPTHAVLGHIAFWLGLAVGNGGFLFTLIAAWRAAEARGDYGGPPA